MKNIAYIVIVPLLIALSWFMIYKVWTLGDDVEDYDTICLGGYQYWYANWLVKGFLAVKLNPEGKPVPCWLPEA